MGQQVGRKADAGPPVKGGGRPPRVAVSEAGLTCVTRALAVILAAVRTDLVLVHVELIATLVVTAGHGSERSLARPPIGPRALNAPRAAVGPGKALVVPRELRPGDGPRERIDAEGVAAAMAAHLTEPPGIRGVEPSRLTSRLIPRSRPSITGRSPRLTATVAPKVVEHRGGGATDPRALGLGVPSGRSPVGP